MLTRCAPATRYTFPRAGGTRFPNPNPNPNANPNPNLTRTRTRTRTRTLTLTLTLTLTRYTGVLRQKKVYTGPAASRNNKPYKVNVKRGVGVGGGGGGDGDRDRQVEAPRGPGREQGRTRVRSLYIGSFSSAHEAALAYARHLGAELSAEVARESARCRSCAGCARRTDCGECKHCLDTIAGGGSVARNPFGNARKRSSCVQRACCNPLKLGALDEWSRQKPALKRAVELLLSKGVRATPPPPPPATPCPCSPSLQPHVAPACSPM